MVYVIVRLLENFLIFFEIFEKKTRFFFNTNLIEIWLKSENVDQISKNRRLINFYDTKVFTI